MEAYSNVAHVFNLGSFPPAPRLVWTYEQRRARFVHANPNYVDGRAARRRQRREYYVRDVLAWRAALLDGAHVLVGKYRLRHSWPELVHAPLAQRTAAQSATRAHARTLMGALVQHGPWDGWGVVQPPRVGPGADRATPYTVPKASEKCWRAWRQLARELARVLLHLDILLSKVIPLHGTPGALPPRGERPSPTRPSPRELSLIHI